MTSKPFLLIHEPLAEGAKLAAQLLKLASAIDPRIGSVVKSIPTTVVETLLSTKFGQQLSGQLDPGAIIELLNRVAKEYGRQTQVVQVGVWDLNAQIGGLSQLVEILNKAQSAFVFFQLETAIPAGMISHKDRVIAWARERGSRFSRRDLGELEDNMIADDFYRRARKVRADLKLDYLVGLTSSMIAFEEENKVYWNYYSTWKGHLLLVSTYGVREYARKVQRPFAAAVGGIIVATLLAVMNRRLDFHVETNGCLFDQNIDRGTIIKAMKNPRIDEECLAKIDEKYREAALGFVKELQSYPKREKSSV